MKTIQISDDTYEMLENFKEEYKLKKDVNVSHDFLIWKFFIITKFNLNLEKEVI